MSSTSSGDASNWHPLTIPSSLPYDAAVAGKVDRIQDPELRASLQAAQESLRKGDYRDVVRRSAEAFLELVRRRPELLEGQEGIRRLFMFPRLGVDLAVSPGSPPTLKWERERFSFSEAVTYLEFATEQLLQAGM
jgi:hypothetical protein